MFDNLNSRLDKALKTLKGQGRITDINVAQTVKEIRRALVDADVNFKVAKQVTDKILEEALGQKVLISVKPGELLTKIVFDELVRLMGAEKVDVVLKGDPAIVLLSGLQGSGKTTFASKLASFYKRSGRQVLLVAADVYRPAAIEQLKVMGQTVGVDVYSEEGVTDPVGIAQRGVQHARQLGKKIVIVDTAGRLAVDEAMMDEIARMKNTLAPSETLFVVDSMTGQDAVNTAKTFNDRINFDGVVLTKLDGDSRGGAALSIRSVVEKPIKFISTGEKPDQLDMFYPDRMAQRILGMGDVISLVERAQQVYDEEEAKRIDAKIRKNQFDINDFMSQLEQLKKMGSIKDLVSMIPGVSKMMKDVEVSDDAFKPIEAMIRSMTAHERENPDLLNGSRRKRIATGSGTTIQQVNAFLTQFDEMRKMMRKMNQMQANPRLAQQLKAGMRK
jgi:signal recognition particle subunit SRP54